MSHVSSPKYSGSYDKYENGEDFASNMKVPKRIRVSGQNDDTPTVNWDVYNANTDKISMNVPERIMVAGGDTHIGTRAIPREIEHELQFMPESDPSLYRIPTPPRSITLDSYTYPTVNDVSPPELDNESTSTSISASNTLSRRNQSSTDNDLVATHELSSAEEVQMLRRQLGRITCRLLAVEYECQQRTNREMVLYSLGVVYFFLKAVFWISRNP